MPIGDRFEIPVRLHPSGFWMGIDLISRDGLVLLAVLDPGSPLSAIEPELFQRLLREGLMQPTSNARSFRIANLMAAEHLLPDLVVRPLPRLTRLKIDILLG